MYRYQIYNDEELFHHGVKGMHWGIRKAVETTGRRVKSALTSNDGTTSKAEKAIYSLGAKINPREMKYAVRKMTNKVDDNVKLLAASTRVITKQTGKLPKSKQAMKAIESEGIEAHKKAKYDNLTKDDIAKLKTYTDSARYSRGVNGYLAIGEPKAYAKDAEALKNTLRKNTVDNQTVYRSCNFKFSVNGVAKKLDKMSEEELASQIAGMSKNFSGKSNKENRVFSTSTSPLFAIDTWREVNPTAAATYNTYMIINCKKCPGVLADGRTTSGEKLVNTRSNQEAILAPNKLTYRKLEYDEERGMFAITVDAE